MDDSAKEFLLQGIADRAAALKSAVFSARGQKKGASQDEKNDDTQIANGEILIHGAIDGGRLRFDYEEPILVVSPEKAAKPILNENLTREQAARLALEVAKSNLTNLTKEDLVRTRRATYFIKTPAKTAFWYNGNPSMFLGAPNRQIGRFIRRFDVNALGLYGVIDFERGRDLNELLNTYRSNKDFEVKENGKGMFTLTFLFDDVLTSNRWAIDIDTAHGFTPLRFRLTEYNKPLHATAVTQSSDVTWKQINGAWVPETFKIWSGEQAGVKNRRAFRSVELTFTFQQVNQPVNDAEFSHKSFPAPASTLVIDSSSDASR